MKNYKREIEEIYKYRIELHAHTSPISPCSDISPEKMARTYSEKGYDGIVITNHFHKGLIGENTKDEFLDKFIQNYLDTKKAAEKYGLAVFLGVEVRFAENRNEYLIYGVDRDCLSLCYDYLDRGVECFRKEVKLPKSVFLKAHPDRDGLVYTDPKLLDGYEIFNMHPGHNSRVAISVRTAKESGADIVTAGSDFHHPDSGHEAVAALRTKVMPKDSYELAQLLKTKDYVFEIGESAIVLP